MIVVQNVSFTFLFLPLLLALLALFGLGLGLILARLNVRYRDVSYLVSIVLNLMFYGTPIIYPLTIVPVSKNGWPLRRIIELNPLTQFVEAFRDVVYDLKVPSAGRLLTLVIVSVVVFLVGFTFFERGSRDVAELL
jgi:ABC-type polysaccharide/polyol phosphate export permease